MYYNKQVIQLFNNFFNLNFFNYFHCFLNRSRFPWSTFYTTYSDEEKGSKRRISRPCMAIGAIITISIILASALTVGILVARSIGKKSSTLRGASLHL